MGLRSAGTRPPWPRSGPDPLPMGCGILQAPATWGLIPQHEEQSAWSPASERHSIVGTDLSFRAEATVSPKGWDNSPTPLLSRRALH